MPVVAVQSGALNFRPDTFLVFCKWSGDPKRAFPKLGFLFNLPGNRDAKERGAGRKCNLGSDSCLLASFAIQPSPGLSCVFAVLWPWCWPWCCITSPMGSFWAKGSRRLVCFAVLRFARTSVTCKMEYSFELGFSLNWASFFLPVLTASTALWIYPLTQKWSVGTASL